MAAMKSVESADQYTVGWIAALPIERAAAIAILDERHNKPQSFVQHPADSNSYTWGRVGEHNIVIASLPAGLYGPTSAATTASNLLSSLPQIRVSLLVGIGGGIARPDQGRDIRLGDIAVSQPQGTSGGVIQYDLGKAKSDNKWEQKGFLSMPPLVLLNALANLQAEHEAGEIRFPEILDSMPKLKKGVNGYSHQGFENDRLFKSSYNHDGAYSCRDCDIEEQIERPPRDTTEPEVHYGVIASGSTLVKDATTRDMLAERVGEECICFEMEAAGLMNAFPCLVIRGICDYADSHKNDQWQRYASATAAAYGKELLQYVPTHALQSTDTALNILKSMDQEIKSIHTMTSNTRANVETLKLDSYSKQIEDWLAPPDTSTNLNEALRKRQDGTGTWLLQSESFREWNQGQRKFLWLHGIPGCGKTLLSARIIDHLKTDSSDILLQFFFDFTDSDKQTVDKLVRSLITQLYSICDESRQELDSLFAACKNGKEQPAWNVLCSTFSKMLRHCQKVKIVIDALDECKTRTDLLHWIKSLVQENHDGLQILTTSRREADIEMGLHALLNEGDIMPIQADEVDSDIRRYIDSELQSRPGFERWKKRPAVQEEIKNELMKRAGGMFRWAACQLDILQNCLDLRMLRQSLKSLPTTLEETYARILAGIDFSHREYATRILQFLTYSERPVTIEESVDIVAVDSSGETTFDFELRMPEPLDIARVCSSLITLVVRRNEDDKGNKETSTEMQLAHFSVQQYLKSDRIAVSFDLGSPDTGLYFQSSLSEKTARAEITKICLAYLSNFDEKSQAEVIQRDFPFSDYAMDYWMDHAKLGEMETNVLAAILKFFYDRSGPYVAWVRHYDPRFSKLDMTPDRIKSGTRHLTPPTKPFSSPDYIESLSLSDYEVRIQMAYPLYYASFGGLQHTVEALIEKGGDINSQGGRYVNALHAASFRGHVEVVQLLLEKGADVNAWGGEHGNALQAAASEGHTKVVQLLLENGADVNAIGGLYGNTLHYGTPGTLAVNYEIVDMGVSCKSALEVALSKGHTETVQLLLEKGADINTIYGIFGNKNHNMSMKMGINHGTITLSGNLGKNALQAALSNGYKDTVQLFLDRGASLQGPSLFSYF